MGFEIPVWFEISAFIVLLTILIADLLLIIKRPHIPSAKESTLWVVFYVGLAIAFAFVLFAVTGSGDVTGQFVAGWLTEYSLSIDNLFVFVLIMGQFAVPRQYQQKVLMVGIIIALILRGIFILLGAVIIEQFLPIFYLFGAFLIYTAWKQAFPAKEHEDEIKKESAIVRLLRRRVDISEEYDGAKVRTVVGGKKIFTPMIIVFVAIGMTDLLFALDSIPAIFGITQDPFIVFTANIFALMGLRQLYFLLGGLLDRLRYLHYGIAFILAFIGVKLIFHAMHENELPFINGGEHISWVPDISTWMSLGVIIASMTVATVASLIASSRDRKAQTPQAAAAAVAHEHRTPATVEEPDAHATHPAAERPDEPTGH
ncbi:MULTISPECIES: TerC family protein [unclassified Microbacterium]|uniref:TerC family protein n=1 Tax=unclassified Microbacterium TaxID=2609290 RepID=UPI00214B461A|nr:MULTISPECIES: TerC family protein [unclassified Microbacterium]MCR2785386.1 TerC family protein [Microbacterium sp. zg.B96]MDL5350471.1 TerC family protein [Microbacterium sp. zg-YB36]WIM14583.1 TerC family protein [Microbacterium sp. zg-B96]